MKTRRTVRAQLVGWLSIPLALLSIADAASSYFSIRRALNGAWDHSLYASTLAISEGIDLPLDGPPSVEIPPVALEVLDTGAQERIFYRVNYTIAEEPPVFMTGYADLPPPRQIRPGAPLFYETTYRGDTVRVAALATLLATDPPTTVTVQVAETVTGRASLMRDLLLRDLATHLVLVVLAGAIGWFAISRGLRPIRSVSREVEGRSPADLTEVSGHDVPEEVAPLVRAVNDLMGRVRTVLSAQRRFIADASHALRTPLAVLRTQAEVALRQQTPAAMREEIAKLRDTSDATGHLATQLLALARAEGARTDVPAFDVDLAVVAREACAALAPVAVARDVDLEFHADEPAPIRARHHQIRELIGNLVDNALRYGAPNGKITVAVERRSGSAVLAVEDDGPGIPEEDRSSVLRPFYRRPGATGAGAGLGLAIVHEIAIGHGAELRLLEAQGGRGLRVEVIFSITPVS